MAERKKIKPRKILSPSAQEKALEMLQQQDEVQNTKPIARNPVVTAPAAKKTTPKKVKPKTQRVTVDFPQALYEEMKMATQLNGQTLRGFIVAMVRNHFKENPVDTE